MPTITNPTPTEAATFSGFWITSLHFSLPEDGSGFIVGSLQPYNGTDLLVANGKRVRQMLPTADSQTNAVLANLITEVKRLKGTESHPIQILVGAHDPTKKVGASVRFADGTRHHIPDCFGLAATDQSFGATMTATLAEIARLAELPFQP